MAAAVEGIHADQCGMCMERGLQRTDPRVVPCGHILCTPCLTADHSRVGRHRCPVCR